MGVHAVFAADTHLSEATWTSRSQIRGDSFFGFRQVVSAAIENSCPLIVAGDCWELMRQPRPSSETISFVRAELDRLADSKCPFYYVNGQHDQLSRPFWFSSIHAWPVHIGGRTVDIGGRPWYGVDFFETSQFKEVMADIPGDTYGVVLHQRWAEFAGSKHFAELTLEAVPYASILVSGDMHKLVISQGMRTQVSPGATHMRTLAEPPDHYCVLFSGERKFEPQRLISRPVRIVEFETVVGGAEDREIVAQWAVSARAAMLEAGCPTEVSTPLVLVNDHTGGDAERVYAKFEGAHVICRLVIDKQGAESAAEEHEQFQTATDLSEVVMVSAEKRQLSGDARKLLQTLLAGESLVDAAINLGRE